MPDLFKPLFSPNLLSRRLIGFTPDLPPELAALAHQWARTAADPAFLRLNEKPLQGQFLTDIFARLLGFAPAVGHLDAYHLKPESASTETKGARTPDARLGFFGPEQDITRVVIELKAPGADLDAKQSGYGNLTPVEQAFGYLAKFDDCRWVILSNFTTVRLYSKRRGQVYAHAFNLADLADPEALRLFRFLLDRERLLGSPTQPSPVDALLEESCAQEQSITRDFYALFSQVRRDLFDALCRDNPPPADAEPAEHRVQLLALTQKILDRVLFVCFCEDTGLLPRGVLKQALAAASQGFVATTRQQQLQGLFAAIDRGNPAAKINAYNGGLFRPDTALDRLTIADAAFDGCLRLAGYDFATDLNVNILGHIFEQSITDLERLRAEIRGGTVDLKKSSRKLSGIFYTPETITQYIVAETIGGWLKSRFDDLEARFAPEAQRTDTRRREARLALWESYREVLRHIKVVDPACGSGAFLIAAFDYLQAEYTRTNNQLAALRGGQTELFDLDRHILTHNLFGVDLSPESVEIAKLALWLKTARTDRPLNDLDANLRRGNSIVSPAPDLPPGLAPEAFDWRNAFPAVFEAGGFDCVVGNPPYIRQEWLVPCKPAFEREFRCYAGTADACLYFIERGLDILRPGGRLGFITSGTFSNANFAAPFRAWLPTAARFLRCVNFGENQPFADAEMVFPTISILEKTPAAASGTSTFRAYFMRGNIPDSIADAVDVDGIDCDASALTRPEWRFQSAAVTDLFDRIMACGRPLDEVVEGRIYYGVKTGLNEAFVIDQATRDRLVSADPACAPILRKMLSGEDLRPWYQEDKGNWLIVMPSGFTRKSSELTEEVPAWDWLSAHYPALSTHLAQFEKAARKRSDQGEFWWELRSCDYYPAFDQPKIFWPDIAKLPRFSWDTEGAYVNNTGYILPVEPWMLGILNSRVTWFCMSQITTPLRLRGGLWQFRCFQQFMARLRIPDMPDEERAALSSAALAATAIARERYTLHEMVRHRLLTDFGSPKRTLTRPEPATQNSHHEGHEEVIDSTNQLRDLRVLRGEPTCMFAGKALNNRLSEWYTLDFAAFRTELRKAFKAEIPVKERADWETALAEWQRQHTALTARLVAIETAIDDRVYRLFNLTPTDRILLADHSRHAMIDYPFGAV
ncbi:MAG: N-6 DNA methylase [Kiritimatiellae bacterium]|nr:N-6 DNA methylase [Kiritimatiellia bacterium]